MNTCDMSRTRWVCAANHPMVATVSYQTVLMASARARGMATWSHTLTLSNPAASHACATVTMSAGVASGSHGMRINVDCACTGKIIPNANELMICSSRSVSRQTDELAVNLHTGVCDFTASSEEKGAAVAERTG